jgi:hypothetical protein
VQQRYNDVRAQLAATPIDATVGPDEWDDIFLYAGYVQYVWPDLADVFAGWVNSGAGAPVVAAYQQYDDPGHDNSYAVYNAVSCTDDTWKDEDFLADQQATYAKAPFLTWANAWFNGPCYHWPAKAAPHTRITGRGVGSALLVGETLDAATPYSGSLHLRSIFKKSRLIGVAGGTSHAVSPGASRCVDRRIFDYLATGKLPARKAGSGADVRCAAPPLPRPNAGLLSTRARPAGSSSPSFADAVAARDSGRQLVEGLLLAAARP